VKPERWLATVLFTDIVGSTERAAELGDRRWRELLETHHALARREIARHHGRELNMTGDGFLATFDAPERALRCACAIRAAVRRIGIEIRGGLHTGEVELVGNNVGGIAVHIAARVLAAAAPGEIVVSSTLRDLVAGAGYGFEDRGTHALKGVPGEWHLYAVASEPVTLPVAGFWARAREARLPRVLLAYLGASAALLWLTGFLRERFGLPDWMLPGAVVLLLIGLIVLGATAWVQSHPMTVARVEREELPGSWELDLRELRQSVVRGKLPHLTWSRSILGGVVAFSLLFGLAGLYVIVQDRGRTFGPPVAIAGDAAPGIAVLPFSVNDASLAKWREGMVDLLATNLDGITGLRTIDSRTVLARWRESVSGEQPPDLATSLEVARRTGARYALVGSAVSSGAGMRLAADVYEVATGKSLGEGQVEGSADSIFGLVDRLSIEVLQAVLKGKGGDLGGVKLARATTTSLPALKAYLDGEVLLRRSDFDGAIAAYQRAVEADSTFALALYRLSNAYGWAESILSELPSQMGARAARFADRLPEREALLVRANLALDRGTFDGLEPLRQAVRRYPDDPEAWYFLGDTYHHLGMEALAEPGEASRAFSKAIELDPTFAPAYIHLIENAFYDADSALAAKLVGTYRRIAPGSNWDVAGGLALALAFGDSSARVRVWASLDTLQTDRLRALQNFFWTPRFSAAQENLLNLRRQRKDAGAFVPIFLFFNNAARGKIRSALDRLRDPLLPKDFPYDGLYSLHARGLPVPLERLDEVLVLRDRDSVSGRALFYTGAYAADRGRWPEHAEALKRLREGAQRALSAGDTTEARFAEGEAEALAGLALWRRGRPAEAAAALEAATRKATGHGPQQGVNDMIRWWLGDLLLELGRPADAARYFESFWGYYHDPLAAYRLAKIDEELREFKQARALYEQFATGWKDADPELQPMVQEARSAIQRLSSAIKE
jgi:tetratricopeptide (TPR) repeat protein